MIKKWKKKTTNISYRKEIRINQRFDIDLDISLNTGQAGLGEKTYNKKIKTYDWF